MLRLLVDKPGGGISLNDLERLSPVLSDLLDVYDPIESRYLLEVASPGINRPLLKLEHFEAFLGQRIKTYERIWRATAPSLSSGSWPRVNPTGIELEDAEDGRAIARRLHLRRSRAHITSTTLMKVSAGPWRGKELAHSGMANFMNSAMRRR